MNMPEKNLHEIKYILGRLYFIPLYLRENSDLQQDSQFVYR